MDGGEARPLTEFPVDVDNLRWNPTGTHLAFSAEVYPEADMAATATRDKPKADDSVKAMKFDRLFIRHWDSWEDGKRSHIFVLPVKHETAAGWNCLASSSASVPRLATSTLKPLSRARSINTRA